MQETVTPLRVRLLRELDHILFPAGMAIDFLFARRF
jgi:hypothetical protein